MPSKDDRRWVNHCERCIYLGQYEKFDLYFCVLPGSGLTLHTCFGNESVPHYFTDSELESLLLKSEKIRARQEAKRLAVERGLLKLENNPFCVG